MFVVFLDISESTALGKLVAPIAKILFVILHCLSVILSGKTIWGDFT